MSKRGEIVRQVKKIFPDLGGLTERLKASEEDDQLESTWSTATVESRPNSAPQGEFNQRELVTEVIRNERAKAISNGIRGLEKIERGQEIDLTPREEIGLEAIVQLEGRPALLIQNGRFFPPPHDWQLLEQERSAIESVISRVARIEVSGHPSYDWLGTGFLIDDRRILTNRHVATEFARHNAHGFGFRTGMSAKVDFLEELGSVQSLEFDIKRVIGMHEELDMAILEIDLDSVDSPLPAPLPIASSEPTGIPGRKVYVVGYPAWDTRNGIEPMRAIFSDIFNVKRLQPGIADGLTLTLLGHDCSTLGGNSGSPVIDLETHQVLGLHFGGRFLESNSSIPLWKIAMDPLLEGANFQ